ncbi:hypothetical protein [Deinococcus pimensis]|uniref:hypothetical protein n=1 Tax=Deinococcus pimensis TaxID=309888 RepID=UPI000481B30A|nr:hypothetical protein [Deinococcus pimensis]
MLIDNDLKRGCLVLYGGELAIVTEGPTFDRNLPGFKVDLHVFQASTVKPVRYEEDVPVEELARVTPREGGEG